MPKIPAPLVWIIERCLAKDPDDRYASTRDLARDLAALRDHASGISVSGVGQPAAAARSARPWRALLAAAVAAEAALQHRQVFRVFARDDLMHLQGAGIDAEPALLRVADA